MTEPPDRPTQPLRAFISYAAEDDRYRIELEKSLKLLQREGLIESWSDRKILAGSEWGKEIDRQLERAELVFLLVSFDFIASDYCMDIEITRALERHDAGEAVVIPILVDDCDWQTAPFAKLQMLPDREEPVASFDRPAQAWTAVARGVRMVATDLVARLSDRAAADASADAEATGATTPDPTRYLEALEAEHSYVELRGMGAQVSERLPLREVYIRLRVVHPATEARRGKGASRGKGGSRGKAASPDKMKAPSDQEMSVTDRELRDVLPEHRHLVLIGDPGSGKTTFLRLVAQCLARAGLGDDSALERIGLAGSAAAPFPIFVRLERVAQFLREHPAADCEADAPKRFLRYLDHQQNGQPHGLPPGDLRRRVEAGECFLLLDGLDEVPGADEREVVVRLAEKLIGAGFGNRHLLTCRTRAYQGRVQLASGAEPFVLAPLGPAQVEQFCHSWSRALFHAGDDIDTPASQQAADYQQELQQAIERNPSGRSLTASPLMLTVLAVVHWNEKKLPEQRAELYDRAIEYLLDSRRDQSGHPTPLRRWCLQAVALAMFEDPEGVQRRLGRDRAARAIVGLLPGGDLEAATAHLEREELLSGILVSRSEGEVEFWHLLFQEYLAALDLAQDDEGWWSRIEGHLYDDRWSEVVLLLAACRLKKGGPKAAQRMIRQILDAAGDERVAQARAVGLVGRIVRDIRPYGGQPEQNTGFAEKLQSTLAVFDSDLGVGEAVRVEVGEALGQADDPRLVDPAKNRVLVDGGEFLMGASKQPKSPNHDSAAEDREEPVHTVLVSSFVVGRYPVTVQEFQKFVDVQSEGYENPRWWLPEGWAIKDRGGWKAPAKWQDQLGHRNRPVAGVSWYEADAYCRFVRGSLPTEAQWEYAARGPDGRRYPWGDEEPSAERANFDMNVGEPTPVGVYPLDRPVGSEIRDLTGNVWEWCADWFGEYPVSPQKDPTGPPTGDYRVLRGGAFLGIPHFLRASYRDLYPPEFRTHPGFGFRVVWRVAGGQGS